MADISDVENSILGVLASVLFPPGYQFGAPTTSLLGPTVRLYRGWPINAELDTDLAAGIAHVTVFTDPGAARNTTRYERIWKAPSTPAVPTLLVSVSGTTVTFSGTPSASHVAGLKIGLNAPVGYRVMPSDTLASIAAALAAKVHWASPTASGPTITFPASVDQVDARTGVDQLGSLETQRQEQTFRITVWAPTPAIRDIITPPITAEFAYISSIALPDGTLTGVPKYRGTYIDDVPDKAHEWRRDTRYCIEYPTLYQQVQTPVLFPYANINGSEDQEIIIDPIIPDFTYILVTEDGANALSTEDGTDIETQSSFP